MKFKVKSKKPFSQLEKIISNLPGIIDLALLEIAEIGRQTAVNKTKGKLAKSIEISPVSDGWELRTNKPYAQYVEFGRGPIRSKSPDRPLVFQIGGRTIYTDEVKAAKPRPFMAPAGTKMKQVANKILHKHISKLIG